jgi:hypothetical protein
MMAMESGSRSRLGAAVVGEGAFEHGEDEACAAGDGCGERWVPGLAGLLVTSAVVAKLVWGRSRSSRRQVRFGRLGEEGEAHASRGDRGERQYRNQCSSDSLCTARSHPLLLWPAGPPEASGRWSGASAM